MTQHHDPVHPDSPHLTPELVADLDADLLDAQSADHARTHLDHCEECRALLDDLAFVVGALGSLPPVEMPADRSADLDAALAGLVGAQGPGAQTTSTDTVVPLDAARRRRSGWSSRIATTAASVAAVLFVSAVALSLMSDGGGGSAGSDTAAAPVTERAAGQFAAKHSGRGYTQNGFARQVDTLLVSYSSSQPATGGASDVPVTDSPAPTQDATPDPMVTATVSGSPTVFPAPLVDPAMLQACIVNYLLFPDTAPLAVDIGTFAGQPAAVIVMPHAPDPTEAEVYVVDPGCSGPGATLFYYALVPLPPQLAP